MVLLLLTCTARSQDIKLRFRDDGAFKIVQFTDTHIDLPSKKNLNVYGIIEKILEAEKPDFAILTGDVITQDDPWEAYRQLSEVFKRAGVPWAVVFGNHDGEQNTPREQIAKFLVKLPLCLNADDGTEDGVYGSSNFVLPVWGENDKIAALIYCMDSNSYSTLKPTVDGYGWFDFSQINWYLDQSGKFTKANGGKPLPAVAFFHIPLPEYTMAWNNKVNPPLGVKNEDECSPDINTGMFTAMLTAGDVMGTFVGHDHINDYIGVYYHIALAYGRVTKVMRNPEEDPLAGGRVIVLREGQRKFETWIRNMDGRRELDCIWPDAFSKVSEKK